jgi:hypothetical protein
MDAYRELTALLPPSVIWSHHQLPSVGPNANSNQPFDPRLNAALSKRKGPTIWDGVGSSGKAAIGDVVGAHCPLRL